MLLRLSMFSQILKKKNLIRFMCMTYYFKQMQIYMSSCFVYFFLNILFLMFFLLSNFSGILNNFISNKTYLFLIFHFNRSVQILNRLKFKRVRTTKGRGQICSSNRKLRKQKKTGHARIGMRSAPHLRGGGHVFNLQNFPLLVKINKILKQKFMFYNFLNKKLNI